MKTVEVKVLSFDELLEEAKQTAIENYRNKDFDIHWADENRESMEAFAKIFPIKIINWSYGDRGEGVHFRFEADDVVEELSGQRLATYIWNNYRRDIFKGKYFSLWSKTEVSFKHYKDGYPVLKKRYSKIMLDDSCVLTGYCMDDDLLNPIYDFLNKPDGRNFKELLDDCFSAWIKSCNADVEHQQSDEYISDHLIANEFDFTEDGERF